MKKVVSVTFSNGPKPYDYFTDMEPKAGDLVVVPAGDFFAVATVLKIKEKSEKATAWVIQKVDLTAYRNRLAEEMFG